MENSSVNEQAARGGPRLCCLQKHQLVSECGVGCLQERAVVGLVLNTAVFIDRFLHAAIDNTLMLDLAAGLDNAKRQDPESFSRSLAWRMKPLHGTKSDA